MQWRKKRVLDLFFSHRCTLSLNWGAFTPMALPRVAVGGTVPYSTAAHTWKFPKALTVSANGNIRPICQCQMCQRQSPYLPPNSFFLQYRRNSVSLYSLVILYTGAADAATHLY